MKVSVETIGGKLCTVIRKPFDVEWVREQLEMGVPVVTDMAILLHEESAGRYYTQRGYMVLDGARQYLPEARIKTVLPALPRRPKPEDAHRYMAEGLYLCGRWKPVTPKKCDWTPFDAGSVFALIKEMYNIVEITHALVNGTRVEIAIVGDV